MTTTKEIFAFALKANYPPKKLLLRVTKTSAFLTISEFLVSRSVLYHRIIAAIRSQWWWLRSVRFPTSNLYSIKVFCLDAMFGSNATMVSGMFSQRKKKAVSHVRPPLEAEEHSPQQQHQQQHLRRPPRPRSRNKKKWFRAVTKVSHLPEVENDAIGTTAGTMSIAGVNTDNGKRNGDGSMKFPTNEITTNKDAECRLHDTVEEKRDDNNMFLFPHENEIYEYHIKQILAEGKCENESDECDIVHSDDEDVYYDDDKDDSVSAHSLQGAQILDEVNNFNLDEGNIRPAKVIVRGFDDDDTELFNFEEEVTEVTDVAESESISIVSDSTDELKNTLVESPSDELTIFASEFARGTSNVRQKVPRKRSDDRKSNKNKKKDSSSVSGNSILDDFDIYYKEHYRRTTSPTAATVYATTELFLDRLQDFFHSKISPSTEEHLRTACIVGAEMCCITDNCCGTPTTDTKNTKRGSKDTKGKSRRRREHTRNEVCAYADTCTDLVLDEIGLADDHSIYEEFSVKTDANAWATESSNSLAGSSCSSSTDSSSADHDLTPRTANQQRIRGWYLRNKQNRRKDPTSMGIPSSSSMISVLGDNDEDIYNYSEEELPFDNYNEAQSLRVSRYKERFLYEI